MKKRYFVIIAIIGLLTACNFQSGQTNEQVSNIQKKIDSLVVDNQLPGMNFSVIFANGEQKNFSSGYANKETKTKMFGEHLMFSGSIGKTYAAAVIFQLVDEGKINLDKKFISYFPNVDWLKRLPNINDITVRMLFEHTSGLPRWVFEEGVWERVLGNPDMVWSDKDRLEYIFDDKAVHEAGKSWAYSDTNYLLLGMLIEKICNNDLYEEIRKRILSPYKLQFTYPSIRRLIPNLAQGYSKLEAWGMPPKVVVDGKLIFNPQMEWTGGGFYSTTSDLAKWAQIYYSGDIFSDKLRKQITSITPNGKEIFKNTSYGMGSFIYHTQYGDMYGHSGTFPGYKSIFAYHPEKKMAFALQINCDYATENKGMTSYLTDVLGVIFKE